MLRPHNASDVAAICRSLPAFFSHDGLDKDVTMVVTSARDLRYKLLVLDVDGTLLTSQAKISPRTRAALDRAREAGSGVTRATGPRRATAPPPLAAPGITLPDRL